MLKTTEYQLAEYQLNNDVTITSFCFVNKSAAEERPGTEVSACEDLRRVTTIRNLQVDREFQEASASLCKRRWRTFWAFTETLLSDLTYVCCFCNTEAERCSKMWSLNNCFINFTAMFSWNICIKCSILYYFRSTEVNEVKLVLQTVNYSRNSVWKFGRKIQNHWDNRAFRAVGSFILPHPVDYISDGRTDSNDHNYHAPAAGWPRAADVVSISSNEPYLSSVDNGTNWLVHGIKGFNVYSQRTWILYLPLSSFIN